jgi:site-specific recombinase XerD
MFNPSPNNPNPNSNQLNLISSNIPESHQQEILNLLSHSKSDNTKLAYDSDWKSFTAFCSLYSHSPIPANEMTIIHYISELSKTLKVSTIKRHISSIAKAHTSSRLISPTTHPLVIEALAAISRTKGNKQTPKKALILDDLKSLIDGIDVSTIQGKRDKALILLGFSTASRRSEIVSINAEDISFNDHGMDINIYESKRERYITKSVLFTNNDYCPVNAIKEWLQVSRIKSDSLFRSIKKGNNVYERLSDKTVSNLIKQYAELAGLDPSIYSGHSLRSGFITSAGEEGYDLSSIKRQSGHNTLVMIDRYTQEGKRYQNNASSILSKL